MTNITERLRSQWGYSPSAKSTLPIEWQGALDEAADTIDELVKALELARAIIVGFEPENGGIATDEELSAINAALAKATTPRDGT